MDKSIAKAAGANCEECPLLKQPFTPHYIAPEQDGIVVVGGNPSHADSRKGRPFSDSAGKLIEQFFRRNHYDWDTVSLANVCACKARHHTRKDQKALNCCTPYFLDALDQMNTERGIMILGKQANAAVFGHVEKITTHRGIWKELGGFKWLPSWHPSYVLRTPSAAVALMNDIGKITNEENSKPLPTPTFEIITTTVRLREIIEQAAEKSLFEVAWDLETDNTVWYDRPHEKRHAVLMMGFAFTEDHGYIIPGGRADQARPYGDEVKKSLLYDDEEVREMLRLWFNDERFTFVAQNGRFDMHFMDSIGIDNARVDEDTMLMKYALDENKPHGLKAMATNYFGMHDYESELVQRYLKNRNDWYSRPPFDKMAQYCVWDVCLTLKLMRYLRSKLKRDSLYAMPYKNLLLRANFALYKVEKRGMYVDVEHLRFWQGLMQERVDTLTMDMRDALGAGWEEFNPNSWQQKGRAVWDHYKLKKNPQSKGYKNNKQSTAADAVEHLASYNKKTQLKVRDGHFFVDMIMDYTRVKKVLSSYVNNILRYVDTEGRVHASIMLIGTEVGRLAMRNPPMQTIPRPDDVFGRIIRSAFIATPGNKFIHADHSQAELRVAAGLSMEEFYLNAYKEDRDVHGETAREMYGEGWSKVQRVQAKMFNFADLYGGTEWSFAQDAGIPIAHARAVVRKRHQIMPRWTQWKLDQAKLMRSQGFVQTIFGRKRRFAIITDKNRDEARKSSIHAPIAGTASDLTLMAAVELVEEGYPVVHLVHDSILLDEEELRADQTVQYVLQKMEEVAIRWMPQVTWKAEADYEKDGSLPTRWCDPPKELSASVFIKEEA